MCEPRGPQLPSEICSAQKVSSSPDPGGEKERELAVTKFLPHGPF